MRTHRQTAAVLFVSAYIAAMAFFAIVRAFGLLWFQQEYIETSIPYWAGFVLMYLFWTFDGVILLKTLTPISWWKSAAIIGAVRVIVFFTAAGNVSFLFEFTILMVIPFIENGKGIENKRRSIGNSALYFAGITAYQLMMIFGRGYPMLGKYCHSWQILLTIDYRLFLFGLFLMKGAVGMFSPGPGCWFFIGKFDDLARKIGDVILKPFERFLRDDPK
jgi:hypothetical protein